jgi:transcriptional regulator with XRE-family HTH domain
MDAGAEIRQFREAGNYSQEDVALALNVTFGAVSQWETGRTHPRRGTAARLDKFLGAEGVILTALGYAMPTGSQPFTQAGVAEARNMAAELRHEIDVASGLLRELRELHPPDVARAPVKPPVRRKARPRLT